MSNQPVKLTFFYAHEKKEQSSFEREKKKKKKDDWKIFIEAKTIGNVIHDLNLKKEANNFLI